MIRVSIIQALLTSIASGHMHGRNGRTYGESDHLGNLFLR